MARSEALVVRPEVIFAIVLSVMAAGCVQTTTPEAIVEPPAREPIEPVEAPPESPEIGPELLEPLRITMTGCNAFSWLHVADFSEIEKRILPPGFRPADVMTLIKVDDYATMGQGVMGIIGTACKENDYSGGPFDITLAGAFVHEPILAEPLEPAWIAGYQSFITVGQPQLAQLFEKYHWSLGPNVTTNVTITLDQEIPIPPLVSRVPHVISAAAEIRNGPDEIYATARGGGGATYHTSNPDDPNQDFFRFWHDSPDGLTYIEARLDRHGNSGTATCNYDKPAFAELFGLEGCAAGESLSVIVKDFGMTVDLYFLPGVHA